jgi:hypothetical protein
VPELKLARKDTGQQQDRPDGLSGIGQDQHLPPLPAIHQHPGQAAAEHPRQLGKKGSQQQGCGYTGALKQP